MSVSADPARLLGQAFASRAEQLRERVFALYEEPEYFPELLDSRSCVLIGGRGTGKTTALRGLSYQGQDSLSGRRSPAEWDYYGVYVRINTSRVTAFQGDGLSDDDWLRAFSHYLNLVLCEATVRFLRWFEEQVGTKTIDAAAGQSVVKSFGEDPTKVSDLTSLSSTLEDCRDELELFVNNALDTPRPTFSMLGAPLDKLLAAVKQAPALRGRPFFFLLDEYENFSSNQQRVANTLIKHAGELYSFKIGIKELGWRSRSTLNEREQLQTPADYAHFDITRRLRKGSAFRDFATRVCDDRLKFLAANLGLRRISIDELMPALSEDAEAELLGVRERTVPIREQLAESFSERELARFDQLPPLYQYLFGFWATGHQGTPTYYFAEFLKNQTPWDTRYINYKHALLYTIRAGRRGIRKYYAGFDTFVELAGGNVRFLVQLVEEALRAHLSDINSTNDWLTTPIPAARQTVAARTIGERNLRDLEGISLIGPRLTRLCVGLGRVFQLMAARPEGHTPEVTQFRIADSDDYGFDRGSDIPDARDLQDRDEIDVRRVIAEAITYLALIRFPGTKLAGTKTATDEYMLHPIYAPVFDYSYRRKRKMTLTEEHITGLVSGAPGKVISDILETSGRSYDEAADELPDQMFLFDQYLRSDG